jgi:hypothetical protein
MRVSLLDEEINEENLPRDHKPDQVDHSQSTKWFEPKPIVKEPRKNMFELPTADSLAVDQMFDSSQAESMDPFSHLSFPRQVEADVKIQGAAIIPFDKSDYC